MRKKDLLQLARFICVGGISVITYFLLLFALTELADTWYVVSATIAYLASSGLNFALQKVYTFKNKDFRKVYNQMGRYACLKGGLLIANVALLYVFVEYARLPYFWASVANLLPLSTISYLVSRRIFQSQPPAP